MGGFGFRRVLRSPLEGPLVPPTNRRFAPKHSTGSPSGDALVGDMGVPPSVARSQLTKGPGPAMYKKVFEHAGMQFSRTCCRKNTHLAGGFEAANNFREEIGGSLFSLENIEVFDYAIPILLNQTLLIFTYFLRDATLNL
jgi:hypothetical protein